MRLHHLTLALCALSLTAALAAPARADQPFWTYSTAPVPKPAATPTYGNIGIEYLYDPCAFYPTGDGRFNPYDTRGNNRMSGSQLNCQGSGHRRTRRPGPPHRPLPPPPRNRIPLAQHT